MTPVGKRARGPLLGMILPASMQGERPTPGGSTPGVTDDGTTGTAGNVADVCRRAEAAGADSLWAVDHLFWPHPIGEAMTTLAVAAGATTRALLGTCVLQLPLRRPAAVAKQATALQLLSGGRFVLGLGVGDHRREYERTGVDFARRGQLMDAGIAELRRAWGADPADPARCTDYVQEPSSTPVPLWIGGASQAARRRVAASGDAWMPLFVTADEYGPALAHLRRETATAGRDPEAVQAAAVVFARVGDDVDAAERGTAWLSRLYRLPGKAFRRHLVAGTASTCAAAIGRFVDAGAHHVVVMVAGSRAVEHFALLREAFGARHAAVSTEVSA